VVPLPKGRSDSLEQGGHSETDDIHRAARFLICGEYSSGKEGSGLLPWKIHVQGGSTYQFVAVNVRRFSDTTHLVELLITDEENNNAPDICNAILDLFNVTELGDGEEARGGDLA
jgi:hypothetical protein